MTDHLQPDVIILDVLLPDRSGWDVLTQLKETPTTQNIPVIVVSVVDERPYGMTLGAAAYLLKPITRQQFQQTLHQVLSHDSLPVQDSPLAASAFAVTAPPTSPLILWQKTTKQTSPP